MVFPGIGHFLVGSCYLGLFWFAVGTSAALGLFGAIAYPEWAHTIFVLVPVAVIVFALQIVDAVRCARRSSTEWLPEPMIRYTVAGVLVITALVGQHALIGYLQKNVFEICYTPTPSMAPLLQEGDRFVTFKSTPIKRWDVVGFNAPEQFRNAVGGN